MRDKNILKKKPIKRLLTPAPESKTVPKIIGFLNKFDDFTWIPYLCLYINYGVEEDFMSENIYLDNAATTKPYREVKEAMEPFLEAEYGNASTEYKLGESAKKAIEKSRQIIADAISASVDEIYFTSGGSEADNWAIKGIAGEKKKAGNHIITTAIEHHAVLNSCEYLSGLGYTITYVQPDSDGWVSADSIRNSLTDKTTIVSVMYANNEIGTIEPISDIGKVVRRSGVIFHTDAVQAIGQLPIDVRQLPVDMLSASAHKFHGPKGVGFLYVRKNIMVPSFIHGGGQERGKRAGTENVAGIVGMGKAIEISNKNMIQNIKQQRRLRNMLVDMVKKDIPDVIYNGHSYNRLPGNASFSFKGVDANALLIMLEESGICASAGSACNTSERTISHVIKAIKVPQDYAQGTVRFSIGADNTEDDIHKTFKALKENIELLRMV